MTVDAVEVTALRSLQSIEPLAAELDALNLASRQPSPFLSFAALRAFCLQLGPSGGELLLLAARRAGRLVGYLPLRRKQHQLLGATYDAIEAVESAYSDRPHVVAAPGEEPACAAAFYRFLIDREPGWSELTLQGQDAGSALNHPPPLGRMRWFVRRFENAPNLTIPLPQRTLGEYYASLAGGFRRKSTAKVRRLVQAGQVEVISSSDPQAAAALLRLYLDLEQRSWKGSAPSGAGNDAAKRAFLESLCGAGQSLRPVFDFVLLDGVPVAGYLNADFGHACYGLETAYDAAHAALSPGYLLHLACVRHLLSRGQREWNLLHDYSYYKTQWKGVVTPTAAVEIFRVPSARYFKARLGELRRMFAAGKRPEQFNPERRRAERGADQSARPLHREHQERAAAALAGLERAGRRVERIGGPALEAELQLSPSPARAARDAR